jgi:Undecaprenyl-phosphate galactose phosphotransferase WbaP
MTLDPISRPAMPAIAHRQHPNLTMLTLACGDLVAIALAGAIAILLRSWANGVIEFDVYARLWAAPLLFIVAFATVNLYPGVAMSAAEELRRLTLTITMTYLVLAATVFLAKEGETYSRGAMLLGWIFTLGTVPLMRGALRMCFAERAWWGFPAVVLGGGEPAAEVVERLHKVPGLGLKPVAVLSDDGAGGDLRGVPVLGSLSPAMARDLAIPYAIVALPADGQARLLPLVERYGKLFPHLIVIPPLFGARMLWLSALDLGGLLGLEVKQRLLLPGPRRTKRAIDLLLTTVGGLLILPLVALLALAVKLTSRGPVFFSQTRIGQGGRRFKAWKFRSMVADAEARLERHLAADPAARTEWERDRKLKNDPRITALGSFLRRSSLDELPQLWNVLRGEMSLIGPRPIVQAEVEFYTKRFHLYGRLKPGLTGLWQVSGRSDTTYAERVDYDSYYVRNWSVWLDLVILARTVWVVLFGRGAY